MKVFYTSLILVLVCAFANVDQAKAEYKVLKARKVLIKNKKIKKGQVLTGNETLRGTSPISYLLTSKDGVRIALKGRFKAQLDLKEAPTPKEPSTINLLYGKVRALVNKKEKTKDSSFKVLTKTAVAGVRGTDFMVSYIKEIDESQIICIDGEVDFGSSDGKQNQAIKKGQWGGFGGRFGAQVTQPIDLPQEALTYFLKDIKL